MKRLAARDAAVLVALVLFGVLLALVAGHWHPLQSFDAGVDNRLNHYFARHPTATSSQKVVSTVFQPATFEVLAVAAAVALIVTNRRRNALVVLLAVFGAQLLSTVTKVLVSRPRPSVPVVLLHLAGLSFPSGHAMASSAAMGALVVLGSSLVGRGSGRVLVAIAVVVVAAVGFSRLALGAHYVSDVLGAWLLAAAWVLAVTRFADLGPTRSPRRRSAS